MHQGFAKGTPTLQEQSSKCVARDQATSSSFSTLSRCLQLWMRPSARLSSGCTPTKYQTEASVSKESSNKDVAKAFRIVSLRAHPDKSGDKEGYQKLTAAYDSWQSLLKNIRDVGRLKESSEQQRPKAAKSCQLACTRQRKHCRVHSHAVLLTYQSFSADTVVALSV